ncbi:MAG: hypothetical protein HZA78_02825 [Candidatus Schekmanbacteria bacterium]|nr:hypothetical protein [Candidatus Schekmanbacteria bacterium]
MDEQYYGKKQEQPGNRLEDIWLKVSKGFEEGIKVGKDEILRTARIGKVRLEIAALKNNKSEKIKLLGNKTYDLLNKGELSTELVLPLYEEIKALDYQIEKKEADVKAILAEKPAVKEIYTLFEEEDSKRRSVKAKEISEQKKTEKPLRRKTDNNTDILSDIETEVS